VNDRRFSPAPAAAAAAAAAAVLAFVVAGWFAPAARDLITRIDRYLPLIALGALPILVVAQRSWRHKRLAEQLTRPPNRRWLHAAGLAGSVTSYLAPVFSGWATGRVTGMVGGTIPFADTQLYFHGAERFLFFGYLDDYNSRRPFNALLLAVRLAITGLDLRVAVILQAVLLGVACYVAARVVARDLGGLVGYAFFAAVYAFAHSFAASPLTEGLGVTLGALAFAALWTAVRDRSAVMASAGVLLLMVALSVRSATPLLPIALVAWFARYLRTRGLFDLRALGMGVAALLVGFSLSYAAIFVGNGNAANLNGNSGYLLYGMARGMPGWDAEHSSYALVYREHPEIVGIPDARRSRIVNSLARDEVLGHPFEFAKAAFQSGVNYLHLAYRSAFEPYKSKVLRLILTFAVVAAIGLVIGRHFRRGQRAILADLALASATVLAIPVLTLAIPVGSGPPGSLAAHSLFNLGTVLILISVGAFAAGSTSRLQNPGLVSFTLVSLAAIALQIPFIGIDNVRILAAMVPFVALPIVLATAGVLEQGPAARIVPSTVLNGAPIVRWAPVTLGLAVVIVALTGAPVARALINRPSVRTVTCADGKRAAAFIGGVSTQLVQRIPLSERRLDEISLTTITPATDGLAVYNRIKSKTTVVDALDSQGNDRVVFVPGGISAPRESVLYVCGEAVPDYFARESSICCWPLPIDFSYFAGRQVRPRSIGPGESRHDVGPRAR